MTKNKKILKTIWFCVTHLRTIILALHYSLKADKYGKFMVSNCLQGYGYNHYAIKRKLGCYKTKEKKYNDKLKYIDELWT